MYLRARWYDSQNGRFNRLDPFFGNLSDPQSLHKYAYVHGDPVNSIDPTGKFSSVESAVAIGITAVSFVIFGAPNFANAPRPGDRTFNARQANLVWEIPMGLIGFGVGKFILKPVASYGGKVIGRAFQRNLLGSGISEAGERVFLGGLDAAQEKFDDLLAKLFRDADLPDFQGLWMDRFSRTRFDDVEMAIFFQRTKHLTGRIVGEEAQHAIDFTEGATRAAVESAFDLLGKSTDDMAEWWHRRVFTRLIQNIDAGKYSMGDMTEYIDDIYNAYVKHAKGRLSLDEIKSLKFDGLY